ncbi:hypothetical protein, partial [Mycolicibacterium gadium]|uniref:hypothetical protein n=1 Tax=Mycolicibacterium gadium TaxID=1794 RepID=UPI0021F3B99E
MAEVHRHRGPYRQTVLVGEAETAVQVDHTVRGDRGRTGAGRAGKDESAQRILRADRCTQVDATAGGGQLEREAAPRLGIDSAG